MHTPASPPRLWCPRPLPPGPEATTATSLAGRAPAGRHRWPLKQSGAAEAGTASGEPRDGGAGTAGVQPPARTREGPTPAHRRGGQAAQAEGAWRGPHRGAHDLCGLSSGRCAGHHPSHLPSLPVPRDCPGMARPLPRQAGEGTMGFVSRYGSSPHGPWVSEGAGPSADLCYRLQPGPQTRPGDSPSVIGRPTGGRPTWVHLTAHPTHVIPDPSRCLVPRPSLHKGPRTWTARSHTGRATRQPPP